MGMFTKATEKAKAATSTAKATKATAWVAGDPEADAVGKAIHQLVDISTRIKALEGQMSLHETIVKDYAMRKYVDHIGQVGVLPETPTYVSNALGERITWISQDRSSQYKVKPEQKEAMVQLLGEDAAAALTYTEVAFKFNRDALSKPGVAEAVEKAIEAVDKKLRKEGLLADEDALVDADVKEAFKPNTLERVGVICGSDTTKIRGFLEAMGSCFTRYLKY